MVHLMPETLSSAEPLPISRALSSSPSVPVSTKPLAWKLYSTGVTKRGGNPAGSEPTVMAVVQLRYLKVLFNVGWLAAITRPVPVAFWQVILTAPNTKDCGPTPTPFVLAGSVSERVLPTTDAVNS